MTMPRQVLVTGETRFIGLVGDPVSHIRSPEFYNPRLVRVGANVLLIPIHVPADLFETAMPGLAAGRQFCRSDLHRTVQGTRGAFRRRDFAFRPAGRRDQRHAARIRTDAGPPIFSTASAWCARSKRWTRRRSANASCCWAPEAPAGPSPCRSPVPARSALTLFDRNPGKDFSARRRHRALLSRLRRGDATNGRG